MAGCEPKKSRRDEGFNHQSALTLCWDLNIKINARAPGKHIDPEHGLANESQCTKLPQGGGGNGQAIYSNTERFITFHYVKK